MILSDIRIRYWFQDRDGSFGDANVYLDLTEGSGNGYNNAIGFADYIGDILASLSACTLTDYDLYLSFANDDDPYIAATPLYEHASFIFETVAGDRFVIVVPAGRTDIRASDNVGIDLSHPDVDAFIGMIINGNGTIAPAWMGNDIIQCNTAYMQWRPITPPPPRA